jgi:signal transduction histidine kinase
MSNSDRSSSILEWVATSLRWLVLLGLAVSLALGDHLTLPAIVTLFVAALLYISLTLLLVLDQPLPYQRYWSVLFDLLLACFLFTLSGAEFGSLAWAGILPAMTAALYFGLLGGGVAAIAALGLQSVIILGFSDLMTTLLFFVSLLPLYAGCVLVMGIGAQLLRANSDRAEKARRVAKQAEADQRKVIFKLVSELSSTLNYQRVLETVLDLSTDALEGGGNNQQRLVSAVLLYTQDNNGSPALRVGSARGFTKADMRISLRGTEGLIGKTIDTGKAQTQKTDISQDPELGRVVGLRACLSAYCLPLFSGLDTYGVLLFSHPSSDFFTLERCELLDMVGKQSIIAIQNARLYRDLEQEKERMMEIQENARNKLARDLHDGPTQSVAAIAMRVNYARRLAERDPKAVTAELFKIEELARRTASEIRHMLFTLRPLVLESQGLVSALESMAEKMHETYNQAVIIQADPGVISRLEPPKQGVVFYLAEEAVNNARKHAEAEHIWVRLQPAGEDLALLEIEDDGKGFDAQSVNENYETRGSLGMLNMRERSELVNGYLKIDSAPGKGTRVSVVIPLTEGAVERARRAR